jgi:endonuclease/exonuclease/phosphatase family metal-dependent hydrolase
VEHLRVVQLNAGSLLEPGWPQRRHEIVAWIDRLAPDIVCLQEIWEDATNANTAAWLVDRLGADTWHWCFGGFAFPPELWPDDSMRFGSAVLSRWPIDRHELIGLPVDSAAADAMWRLQLELLHARTAGIDVFSVHLAPPPEQAYHRVRQVVALDDEVRRRHDPTSALPPVICGDFNAEPDSEEIRYLTAAAVVDGRTPWYQDAWRVAGPETGGWTQHPANPMYAPLGIPRKRIDYVFVGNPFGRRGGLVTRADLAFHEPMTGTFASDHFGLVVDVAWNDRPSGGHTTSAPE